MASRRNAQNAVINTATAGVTGTNIIVTNPSTTAFMYIWAIMFTAAGAATLQFMNGINALTGQMSFAANGQFVETADQLPLYTVDPGQSFILNQVSTTAQISGALTYSN